MTSSGNVADPKAIFVGRSEMAQLMRAFDWSATPLGPPDTWPQSLRTALGMMLESRFGMYIAWGKDFTAFYNDGYRPILGSTKHPAIGKSTADTFQESWHIIGPLFEQVMEGKAVGSDDWLLPLDRHGYLEECHFIFSYSPIRDESGAVGGVLVTVAETTERVLGERRMRTLRDLAAAASAAKTPDEAWRGALGPLDANRADLPFAMLYQVDPSGDSARLIGGHGLAPDHQAAPLRLSVAASEGGWPVAEVLREGHGRVATDLGERFGTLPGDPWPIPPHSAAVLPITRPGLARPYGLLIAGLSAGCALDAPYREFLDLVARQIATGVSNAYAYEEERQRAEALAELDRAKTVFFSNVSHEFRTPLTLSLGPVEDLLSDVDHPLSAEQRERLEIVQRNHLRLLKLVNSLLDFARIEAGRVQAVYEPTDLARYTADLASNFRSATERAGLRLVVDCPPLPEPVYVDRDMWEKIVLNLVSNAFKFTFEGEIAVSLRADGGTAELVVRDTGVGIPGDEISRVFERFHRVEGTRARTVEGSGIGLALVRELVNLHGGTVEAASLLGKGSTFTVRIPTGQGHLLADHVQASRTLASTALGAAPFVEEALRWLPENGLTPRPSPAELERGEGDLSPSPATLERGRGGEAIPRILVADDNADMREYVRRLLATRYQVEAVGDGRQALQVARENPPDLVLADVMMPELDGFGLLRELRADPRTTSLPVVLVSARAGDEARVAGLEAKADDYLVKPFGARDLLARVESHLALARLRRENELALRAAQERLRIALAASATGTFRWNPITSEFLDFDENLKALFGMAPDEPVRVTEDFIVRVHPEDLPALLPAVERCRQGEDFDMEYRVVWPDGSVHWLYDRGKVQRDADGNLTYLVGACTEITRRKQVEIELARLLASEHDARQQAEAAVRARDEFLSVAAHELKTPITSLRGTAQLSLRRLQVQGRLDPNQTERALRLFEEQTGRLVNLVNQLLDVSRITVGKLRLETTTTDLSALVMEVVEQAQTRTDCHPISVSTSGPLLAEVDPLRLEQVFTNLIDNAVKYSPEGGTIEVEVGRLPNGNAMVRVRDHGLGIAPEHRPHIFERFYQAHRDSGLAGLGLGLYVSRKIVELHGGRIDLEFPPDGGTCAVVELARERD